MEPSGAESIETQRAVSTSRFATPVLMPIKIEIILLEQI